MTEELTLNVDGKVWGGWTDMTINRSLVIRSPSLHQARPVLYGLHRQRPRHDRLYRRLYSQL